MTIAESWQLDMKKPQAINGGADKHSNGKPHSSDDQVSCGWVHRGVFSDPTDQFLVFG